MKNRGYLIAAVLLLLSGCSLGLGKGDYSCKGYPEGVQCKSAREVYELTNYQDSLTKPKDDQNAADCPECQRQPGLPVTLARFNSPAEHASTNAVQGLGYAGPMPLRSAAQIMRIYVAPWESTDGALHLPTYMYVEVMERRWSIGERKMEIAPQITPLEDMSIPTAPGKAKRPEPKRKKPVQRKTPQQSLFGPQKSKNATQNSFFNRKTGRARRDNINNLFDSEL